MSRHQRGRPSPRVRIIRRTPTIALEQPFEVFLVLLGALSGLATLLRPHAGNALDRTLPTAGLYAWGGALVLGSTLTLVGLALAASVTHREQITLGRGVERLGMLVYLFGGAIWSVALITTGLRALPSAMITAAFAAACGVRAFVLRSLTCRE